MDEEKKEYQIQREINIRKIIITGIVVVLILAVVIIFSLYIAEEGFRKWVDINVLRKDISSESVATVDLNVDKNNQIVCYNKYIGIFVVIFIYICSSCSFLPPTQYMQKNHSCTDNVHRHFLRLHCHSFSVSKHPSPHRSMSRRLHLWQA